MTNLIDDKNIYNIFFDDIIFYLSGSVISLGSCTSVVSCQADRSGPSWKRLAFIFFGM